MARAYGHLHEVLIQGQFAITCEIAPPRSASVATIRKKARSLRTCVDAINEFYFAIDSFLL